MKTILERLANEPAVLVAVVLAAANVGFGVDVDLEQVTELRQQILETLVLLFGGGIVRQTVYGPRTVDDILDAETVIRQAEDEDG